MGNKYYETQDYTSAEEERHYSFQKEQDELENSDKKDSRIVPSKKSLVSRFFDLMFP